MPQHLQPPVIYLITSGETTPTTHSQSEEFLRLLGTVEAAVHARVNLLQLREKQLSARALYELTTRAAAITRGSETRLIVNDRADIARAGHADGVHLTTRSLEAHTLRRAFGDSFLIGVSTHSLAEARAARDGGADFATFGPVFETVSKLVYGPPVGPAKLNEAARALSPFPLLALGGITQENADAALQAGASGVAAIRLFNDPHTLDRAVRAIRGDQ
jgi:thiamine-phosphate pyrophosphorylase